MKRRAVPAPACGNLSRNNASGADVGRCGVDVDVGRLFSDETADEKITVDRAKDRAGAEGGRYRALASTLLGKSMSPFVVRPAGTTSGQPQAEHWSAEYPGDR